MFVFKGSDLAVTMPDDEHEISVVLPERRGQHCGAVGKALAAHFSYYPQRSGLESQTDLLMAYEALASKSVPSCSL